MTLSKNIFADRVRDLTPQLRQLGVSRLALFGSHARDEAKPDSDVDLLIEFEPGKNPSQGLFRLRSFLKGPSSVASMP